MCRYLHGYSKRGEKRIRNAGQRRTSHCMVFQLQYSVCTVWTANVAGGMFVRTPARRSMPRMHRFFQVSRVRAANVLTLSCKDRPPRRPQESGTAAAATNTKWQERAAAGVTRACSWSRPKAAPPPRPRAGGVFWLLGEVGGRWPVGVEKD